MCLTVCDGIIRNLLPTDKQHCHIAHAFQCSTEIERLVDFGMHMNTTSDSQANTQHKLQLVMNTKRQPSKHLAHASAGVANRDCCLYCQLSSEPSYNGCKASSCIQYGESAYILD